MAVEVPTTSQALAGQLDAVDAYTQAVNELKFRRAQRQARSGLTGDWKVDPRAQFGMYQALLQRQGHEMDLGTEEANNRGFFGPGLANQAESLMRYANAVENYQFQQQLMDWENEYQMGLQTAERNKQQALVANAAPKYPDIPPSSGGDGGGDSGGGAPVIPPWQDTSQVNNLPGGSPFDPYYVVSSQLGYATPFSPGKPVTDKYANPYRRG